MSVSAFHDLPPINQSDLIDVETSEEQRQVIEKAAELRGWTVPQYILCAALDRAERDLYSHAALTNPQNPAPHPEHTAAPLTALTTAFGTPY